MTDFYGQLERQLVDAGRRRLERGRWRTALAGRGRPLLAVVTVLLALAAAAAAGVSALRSGASSDAGRGASPSTPPVVAPPSADRSPTPNRTLRGTRVAVLNGTRIAGLGRATGRQLEAQGATIETIGDAADQQQAQTVVGYRPGAGARARLVATILGVRDVRPRTAGEEVLAPRADVVVLVGPDLTPR